MVVGITKENFNNFVLISKLPLSLHVFCAGFTAVLRTLRASGSRGPRLVSGHYTSYYHDRQVEMSSGIQLWTVSHTGEYRIEAIGASGGAR